MPLPLLVDKLSRGGGGGLERRHLAALTALGRRLPHRSAAGYSTAPQLADTVGYSGRWMREALADLEALGLLTWHRGGVRDGRPTPSLFRVDKRALVELVRQGLAAYADLVAARTASTRARLAGLRYVQTRRRRHKPSSDHAEVGAHLYPKREEAGPALTRTGPIGAPVQTCEHGGLAGQLPNGQPKCPSCRRAVTT